MYERCILGIETAKISTQTHEGLRFCEDHPHQDFFVSAVGSYIKAKFAELMINLNQPS